MQVTKTVQKVPLLHGHKHEGVIATGRSCRRWRFAPDCLTRQSNAASDRPRLDSQCTYFLKCWSKL